MIYKKQLLILVAVILSTGAKNFSPLSYDVDKDVAESVRHSRKVSPLKQTQEYVQKVDFTKLFKNLRRNRSPEEIRIVGTLGLLASALKIEEDMRENLYMLTDELLNSFNKSTPRQNTAKLFSIEETINRDKSAVAVLNGMLAYARNATTLDALQKDMQHILRENEASSKRLRSKKMAAYRDGDESVGQKSASTGKLISRSGTSLKYNIKERLYDVREMIDNHVDNIHSSVTENVKQTIKYVQHVQKRNEKLMKPNTKRRVKLDPSLIGVKRLWDQVASSETTELDFDVDLNYQPEPRDHESEKAFKITEMPRITKGEQLLTAVEIVTALPKVILVNTKVDRFKRQNAHSDNSDMSFVVDLDISGHGGHRINARQDDNEDDNEIDDDKNEKENENGNKGNQVEMSEQNEEEFDSSEPSSGPGGLVGLITNLSGGDEGSDVGAVLGALSQVITNLLGPGGLDIPGLVSSGTALLASLLAGDDNFGKVLGNIFGLAIDGFSGGGGAANNGQFFGQFIGKFISMLSADPEEDGAPLQPDTFINNFFDGIGKGSADDDEEAKPECDDGGGGGGSDSSGFIASLVSGLVQVFAKASSGSSAGASQGSIQGVTGLSGGSSSGSSGASSKKPA